MVYVKDARQLKQRAAERGLLQVSEIAAALGERPQNVSPTINGRRSIGRPHRLRRWCETLGISADEAPAFFEVRLN